MELKSEYDFTQFEFLGKEFRRNNFYTLKSSFGDTRKWTKDEDLYLFPSERIEARHKLDEMDSLDDFFTNGNQWFNEN